MNNDSTSSFNEIIIKTDPTIEPNESIVTHPILYISSKKVFRNVDDRPHACITIGDTEHTMLLDSGSQVTVIGQNLISKLDPNWREHLKPTKFNISPVDESHRYIPLGMIDLAYTYMHMTRVIPTVVLDVDTSKPILGQTFLKAFDIDFAKRTASGWIPIPTFSIKSGSKNTNTIHVNTLGTVDENSSKRPMMTASQFIGWLSYEEQDDFQHVNSLETAEPIDPKSPDRDFLVTDNPDDDVIPSKTTCVNTPHNLTKDQQSILNTVLELFQHTTIIGRLNHTDKLEHAIDTGDAKPIMKKQYPFSPYVVKKVQKELDKMLERDIIMTIDFSPWRAPILVVDKKDGGCRVCLDARELNKVTVPNAYPITDVNHILSRIRTARYLSSIDLSQAFFQIPLEKDSQYKTAFAFGNRLYCFKRMTMGLKGSPATLATLIDTIFRDLSPYAFAYVDDFIICTETFEQHMQILTIIARRLTEAGLTISPSKSHFCCKKLEFLGYVLSENGLEANPEKVTAIQQYPRPTTAKEARRFIGAAGWYRKFIDNFAEVAAPINDLYKGNKKGNIEWNDEAEKSFNLLKEKLTTTPVLAMPDYDRPFTIYSDASLIAGAAVLSQKFDDGERVIQYFSKKFTPPQQNYSASERECLAVLLAVEKFRPYVEGVPFTVVTDHAALKWLMTLRDPKGRLARWALRLQAYQMNIVHKAGKHMEMPDALSRAVNLINIKADTTNDSWYRKMMKRCQTESLDRYKIIDNQLFHRFKFTSYGGERLWVLCVPSEQRDEVLKEHHDDYSHQGIWKTYHRMRNSYYWPDMLETIYQYVRKCEACRLTKPSNENTRVQHGRYREPKMPGRQLSIDLMGKFPMSKSKNQYLFVALDCFSRFAYVKPLRFATSQACIQYLRDVVFPNNGCPEIIISDNGKQFVSNAFEEMCKNHKITHWKTPAYHPKANQVEATNKSIKTALRIYLLDEKNHSNWERNLEKLVLDLNTTPHTSTGKTPFYLNFGRENVRSGDEYKLMDANPHYNRDPERLKDIREEAREVQGNAYDEAKIRRSARTIKRIFNDGAEVFISNNKLSSAGDRYASKLASPKIRAYVKRKIGSDSYELVDKNQKSLGIHHADEIMTR